MAITLKELDSFDFPEAGKRDRGYSAEAVENFRDLIRKEFVEVYTRLQETENALEETKSERDVAQSALAERPAVVDQTVSVATQSAELLARAEALANEHVRNAETAAHARVAEAEAVLNKARVEATSHAEESLAQVREKTNALVSAKKAEFTELEESVRTLREEEADTRNRLRDYFTRSLEELNNSSSPSDSSVGA